MRSRPGQRTTDGRTYGVADVEQFQTLDVGLDQRGVATIALNRPERHNAMDGQLIRDLSNAAIKLDDDPEVRVVVLAANGKSFCAGADLGWVEAMIGGDHEFRIEEASRLASMFNTLDSLGKPLVGRIHGQAFGGGIGLICVCDVSIGVSGSRFGLTETRLGLVPATIGPYVVNRLGVGNSRWLFASPRLMDSEEALDLGILSRVVQEADLDGSIEDVVAPFLVAAPGAVRKSKSLVRRLGREIDKDAIQDSVELLVEVLEGDEAKSGIGAFFAKTTPPWQV